MEEFKSINDLYNFLKPAFNVKLRILDNKKYFYIKNEDIWNYLKENKWINNYDLTLAEMVNDIIHCDDNKLDKYLKEKISLSKRDLYFNS